MVMEHMVVAAWNSAHDNIGPKCLCADRTDIVAGSCCIIFGREMVNEVVKRVEPG